LFYLFFRSKREEVYLYFFLCGDFAPLTAALGIFVTGKNLLCAHDPSPVGEFLKRVCFLSPPNLYIIIMF